MCNNDSDLPIDLCDAANAQMREFLEEEMRRQAIDAEYERRKEELIMYEDARKMDFEDKVQAKTGEFGMGGTCEGKNWLKTTKVSYLKRMKISER